MLVVIATGFFAASARACGCPPAYSYCYCHPTWSVEQHAVNSCSNVPYLSPYNDTGVNLRLLLLDEGLAKLEIQPDELDGWVNNPWEWEEYQYGQVPFHARVFLKQYFRSLDTDDDEGGQYPPSYESAEGTPWITLDTGQVAFEKALEAAVEVPVEERDLLIRTRRDLWQTLFTLHERGESTSEILDKTFVRRIASPAGTHFLAYLQAVFAFYTERYSEAKALFTALQECEQPWVRETAHYMISRTALLHAEWSGNRIQQNNDGSSYTLWTKASIDTTLLGEAVQAIRGYLQRYPSGRYAASARGFFRCCYSLAEDYPALIEEYRWQFEHLDSAQSNLTVSRFAEEVPITLPTHAQAALLRFWLPLACNDLYRMRRHSDNALSLNELQAQRPAFIGHEEVFEYLLAAHHYFIRRAPGQTLTVLNRNEQRSTGYTAFSSRVLRGLALEATGEHRAARRYWEKLLKEASSQLLQSETLQLALALNYKQSGEVGKAFDAGSPIVDPYLRNALLHFEVTAPLLRKIAITQHSSVQERHRAVFLLLYGHLIKGKYKAFVRDHALLGTLPAPPERSPNKWCGDRSPDVTLFSWSGEDLKDGLRCPSIVKIATILAADPQNPYGLLCLGDFVLFNEREHDVIWFEPWGIEDKRRPSSAPVPRLGVGPDPIPGKVFSRGEAYKAVLARSDAPPDLQAYALHRLVKCYAPAGINHCGDRDVPRAVRKAWFTALKTEHGRTVWAKSLPYYW